MDLRKVKEILWVLLIFFILAIIFCGYSMVTKEDEHFLNGCIVCVIALTAVATTLLYIAIKAGRKKHRYNKQNHNKGETK